MDLSALIFVALAVAWAVYLIPKALRHHDEVVRSRSVDRFSHTMRVLARREPVNRRNARLVVTPGRPAAAAVVVSKAGAPAPAAPVSIAVPVPSTPRARRELAARAARRRLRVVLLLLAANVVVAALAILSVVAWPWLAVPAGLLVAWLVACRLMVKRERAAGAPLPVVVEAGPVVGPESGPATVRDAAAGTGSTAVHTGSTAMETDPTSPATEEFAAVVEDDAPMVAEGAPGAPAPAAQPALWDPLPVTLPTYVGKPAATRRTVRTIDLDATGVWTSGRTEADSQLVREADEAARATRTEGDDHRAVGS